MDNLPVIAFWFAHYADLLVQANAMMGTNLFPVDPTHVRIILFETATGPA